MAACTFTLPITIQVTDLVKTLQSKIEGQGGKFTGTETDGTFGISLMGSTISGSYTIEGAQITIIINEKPFFIGCEQIRGYLLNNL